MLSSSRVANYTKQCYLLTPRVLFNQVSVRSEPIRTYTTTTDGDDGESKKPILKKKKAYPLKDVKSYIDDFEKEIKEDGTTSMLKLIHKAETKKRVVRTSGASSASLKKKLMEQKQQLEGDQVEGEVKIPTKESKEKELERAGGFVVVDNKVMNMLDQKKRVEVTDEEMRNEFGLDMRGIDPSTIDEHSIDDIDLDEFNNYREIEDNTIDPQELEEDAMNPVDALLLTDEEKLKIDNEFKREFWASQMTMRDSLKEDGGEFLANQTKYSDRMEGYKQLGKRLMDRHEMEKKKELEVREKESKEITKRLNANPRWASLPTPEELDQLDEIQEDGDEEDVDEVFGEDDGLPDLSRLQVKSGVSQPMTYGELMAEKKLELLEHADTQTIDDFEKNRKLKRIEFMSKKLAIKEQQRKDKLARMGINEEEMEEIDPEDFQRFQAGEITEEELSQLARKFNYHDIDEEVEGAQDDVEDAEFEGEEQDSNRQMEEDEEEYEEKPSKYHFLRHWKIGSIEVPVALKRKISQQLKGNPTEQLRIDASKLSDSLRERTRSEVIDKSTPFKVAPEEKPVIVYGKGQALAYIAHRMPGVYACTHRVFSEIAQRIPNFKPKTMLDYGSGPGTVIWSAREIWGDSLSSIKAVEPSTFMTDIAKKMLEGSTNQIKWSQFLMTPPQLTEGLQSDLVVASYVLSELANQESRREIIKELWKHVKPTGMLVLLEPGTPIGFSLIREMRQMILDLPNEYVSDVKHLKGQVVAPCPHSGKCPMGHNSWCHFSQRLERPVFQKLAKGPGSTVSFEDEKYSYIVLSKMVHSSIPNQLEKQLNIYGQEEVKEIKPWARLNEAPFKRGGHVTMDVCTPSGDLKRVTIARSHGKQLYRDARKSFWSDGIIYDESKIQWIQSRNQILQSEVEKMEKESEEEKSKPKGKVIGLRPEIAFSKERADRELSDLLDAEKGHLSALEKKKLRMQQKEEKKQQEWMDDLGKNDRKMLEKLVKEGKFSFKSDSLFGSAVDGQPTLQANYTDSADGTKRQIQLPNANVELKDTDKISFVNEDKPKKEKKLRESSKAAQERREALIKEIDQFTLQNMQPHEREEYEKQSNARKEELKQGRKREPKIGTMEYFLEQEEMIAKESNGGELTKEQQDKITDIYKTRLQKRSEQQQRMYEMMENVSGMGINTSNNRKNKHSTSTIQTTPKEDDNNPQSINNKKK